MHFTRRSCLLAVGAAVLLLGFSSTAWAHDADITTEFSDFVPQDWEHPDEAPFKGWLNIYVTNTGTVPWGDFHFEFYDPLGTQDISNLAFLDLSMGGYDPTSSQSGLTWSIDNVSVPATLDLYYWYSPGNGDPVLPGESAEFFVYTDNTTDELPIFGMIIYPTAVPEPTTLLLLGFGALAVRRSRR